jgi:DNA processing protein
MMPRDELAAWLRLGATAGMGRATARRLLAAFGSPERVLGAERAAMLCVADATAVQVLLRRDARDAALLEATWRWLQDASLEVPRDVIALGDPRYPALLLEAGDPPVLLFTLGRAELLAAPALAIVGSRKATPQGVENAREFARELSRQGHAVVSGLAMGIDGAAHEGALAGPGSTIAFVGTGLDRTYPARHAALAARIAAQGLIASEYPLGTPPLPVHFPRRNRLIAGLARGTLVVEAALPSGSLITAQLAVEAGREVFAIPGSIHSPYSQGCHRLIQQGAKLVTTAADVLQEFDAPAGRARMSPAQERLFPIEAPQGTEDDVDATSGFDDPRHPDAALIAALGHDPSSLDALAARTGWPADRLAARLLDLELAGAVRRLPGGLLQRCATA